MALRSRDIDILRSLAVKVRLFSLDQVAVAWWTDSTVGKSNARRRLKRLTDAGLLGRHRVHARPLPPLAVPVHTWSPGDPTPDFGQLAWKLQSRWTQASCPTTVYIATRQCANQFGGRQPGELKHDFQATHDLGVSAVYLHLRETAPALAKMWVGEDLLRSFWTHRNLPDAALTEGPGRKIKTVIEFGGAYDARRVRRFHEHSQEQRISYELW